jgi:hypothetical protein
MRLRNLGDRQLAVASEASSIHRDSAAAEMTAVTTSENLARLSLTKTAHMAATAAAFESVEDSQASSCLPAV